jgi:putative ABC transport system permease protein
MWWKLLWNSFRRDARRKSVAITAVCLATCLATFLLNWSLNLGDKIQRDLRAYGFNVVVVPRGESLPLVTGVTEAGTFNTAVYLNTDDLKKIQKVFWKNQITSMAPVLEEVVKIKGQNVRLVGTEFGERHSISDYRKIAPYVALQGRWPTKSNEVAVGEDVALLMNFQEGSKIVLQSRDRTEQFVVTGIARSGGAEDHQVIGLLASVQKATGRQKRFKRLLISALVKPNDQLFYKYQRNPDSLSSQEMERYSCTPYITSVGDEVAKVFPGAEARVVRQVSETEEKVVRKVNWLMILVTLAALIAASLTMTSTTTAMILERRKELALMKAIGSNNAFIAFYLIAEVVLLGAIGSLLGYGLGTFLSVTLSRTLFESPFELKWAALPIIAIIGTLIILFGSYWPLRQATTLEPAHALKDL